MSDDTAYIHKKFDDIEANMATKSDIAIIKSELGNFERIAEKIEHNTEVVSSAVAEILQRDARQEEVQNQLRKDVDKALEIGEGNKSEIGNIKIVNASNQFISNGANWMLRGSILLALGAVAALILK